jgi:hypothetical protein
VTWLSGSDARAQATARAAPAPAWRWNVTNLTRVEAWSFFTPPSSGGDPDSLFVGSRTRVGLSRTFQHVDLSGAVQFVQFGGLPTRAVGPGFLGTGGLYYEHSGHTDSRGFYLSALNARLRLPRGVQVLVGRMGYTSGAESPSGHAKIETVKRGRVDSRLVGDFEWSLYQRAFDGVRIDMERPTWHASLAWLRPTQGGFEEDAGARIDEIDVAAATVTFRPGRALPASDLAAFVYVYDDDRPVTGRPDNTARSADRARVRVRAFGASTIGSARAAAGELDWLVWMAAQTGSWYEQRHRAWSLALESGCQWSAVPWQPWLRAGYLHASGDDDAADDRHGTFFPMLPTVRRYAFTTAYAPMNLRDAFAEVVLRPSSRLRGRFDVRRLRLDETADRWYAGSGATRERGSFFGYAGRPSGGHADLGTVIEGAVDVTIGRRWSVNAFLGAITGGSVVRTTFDGSWLRYGYVESVVQF